jgi:hypothetical protein
MATPTAGNPLWFYALVEFAFDRWDVNVEALQHAACSRAWVENDSCEEMFGTEVVMAGTPRDAGRSLQVPSRLDRVGRFTRLAESIGQLVRRCSNTISRQAVSLQDGSADAIFEQTDELMVGSHWLSLGNRIRSRETFEETERWRQLTDCGLDRGTIAEALAGGLLRDAESFADVGPRVPAVSGELNKVVYKLVATRAEDLSGCQRNIESTERSLRSQIDAADEILHRQCA